MSSPRGTVDLSPLEDAYRIVGELRARGDARYYIGKRLDDGTDVLVAVMRKPEGDERNALSHLAADTKLLVGHRHRNLIRILDGRWVGDDAFAVVSARVASPTLRELLDRGETLSPVRIAAILREVNGVLEWAREQRIVNRAVTPDSLFLDPKTDRVLVSFGPQPIHITGRGDHVEEDARTIGAIAWAMLARTADRAEEGESLADLRPDLPARVIEATEALAGHAGAGAPIPDVRDYVAAVGMSEALMAGELEIAHMQAIMLDERHEERRHFEATRRELEERMEEQERRLAHEKKELLAQVAAERAALTRRSEELERKAAEEHAALEARRVELERTAAEERDELQRAIAAERAEMQSSFAKQREELHRAVTKQREELERGFARQKEELERGFAKQREEAEHAFAKHKQQAEHALAKQRQEQTRALVKQRQELERDAARQKEAFAAERAVLQREIATERDRLVVERTAAQKALAKQQQEAERALAAQREAFAKERAAFDRAATLERERLAEERAALERERADVDAYWAQAEARLRDHEHDHDEDARTLEREVPREVRDEVPRDAGATAPVRTTVEMMPFAPSMLAAAARERASGELLLEETDEHPRTVAADRPATEHAGAAEPTEATEATGWRARARRLFAARWTIPGAGLVLVAALGGALVTSDGARGSLGDSSAAVASDEFRELTTDSAHGSIEASLLAPPTPDTPTPAQRESATVVSSPDPPVEPAQSRDTMVAEGWRVTTPRRAAAARDSQTVRDTSLARADSVVAGVLRTLPGRDTTRLPPDSLRRPDSLARQDSLRRPR